MNGLQFLGILVLLAGAAIAVHRDRHVWSRIDAPADDWPSVQDAQNLPVAPTAVLTERQPHPAADGSADSWLEEVSGWVAEQDSRSGVYAQVSRDVAAHRAHVEGSAA